MHLGIILLTKNKPGNDTPESIKSNIENSLDNIKECMDVFFDYYEIGGEYDCDLMDNNIMLATECESAIAEYTKDQEKIAEEYWQKMLEAKQKEKSGEPKFSTMSALYASQYSKIRYNYLTGESGVYNIDNKTHDIPEDLTGYWAVMVDFHC